MTVHFCSSELELASLIKNLTAKSNYPCDGYKDIRGFYLTCRRRFWTNKYLSPETWTSKELRSYKVSDIVYDAKESDTSLVLDFETFTVSIAVLSFSRETVSSGFNMKCLVTQKKYPKLRHSWIFVKRIFSDFFAKV